PGRRRRVYVQGLGCPELGRPGARERGIRKRSGRGRSERDTPDPGADLARRPLRRPPAVPRAPGGSAANLHRDRLLRRAANHQQQKPVARRALACYTDNRAVSCIRNLGLGCWAFGRRTRGPEGAPAKESRREEEDSVDLAATLAARLDRRSGTF